MADVEYCNPTGKLTEVAQWLVERSKAIQGSPLDRIDLDFDLVDSGLIDSLRLVEFAFVLGKASGRPLNLRDLKLDQFRTIRLIGAYLEGEVQ